MTSSFTLLKARTHPSGAFTLMEILVVVAIILVLAAIAFPVYGTIRNKADKAAAINQMKQLTSGIINYAAQNDQTLPAEDSKGTDTWQAAADPENAKAWYNAVPKLLGQKSVGEFSNDPRLYYTKENILYLPGATYPATDKKLVAPLFAIAFNTKLQRKDEEGKKTPVKLAQVTNPAKTVMFLEQGLPGEQKASGSQSRYDGSCKGSARSFVARYGGEGMITFLDGHSESVSAKDLLDETGKIIWQEGILPDIIWCRTPEEDPNK